MAKRFKLRIPTFNSCRSKNPSSAPFSPTRRHHNHHVSYTTPPPQPHLYRSKSTSSAKPRHHSTSSSNPRESQDNHGGLHRTRSLAEFRWQKEDRWLVITKINLEEPSPPLTPPTLPRRRKIDDGGDEDFDGEEDCVVAPIPTRRRSMIRLRLSTSSTESSNLFTTTSNQTAAGDSSLSSFSTDSSLESTRSKSGTSLASSTTKLEKFIRSSSSSSLSESDDDDEEEEATAAARLSVFKRLIPCGTLEGSAAVRESLAVVKRSEDPYEDFRRSMMEMVLEKHLFEVTDLERVLQILLSLNSKRHHGVIAEAFEEIKEALFCRSSRRCSIDEFLR